MPEIGHPELETNKDGKDVALISYLTFIGWLIALMMNSSKKTQLGLFHIRQSLGIMVSAFFLYAINDLLSPLGNFGEVSSGVLNIVLVIFWIMGLVSAVKAEEKPLPFVGELFQRSFARLK